MKTVWKKSGICPLVEVSEGGQIRLLEAVRNGRYPGAEGRWKSGHVLSQITKHGYATVRVKMDGKRKQFAVQRLVCDAFNGPAPTPKHHAAHRDGNKKNNHYRNLYWATAAENIADRERHGTTSRGKRHSDFIKKGLKKCSTHDIR